MRVCKPDHPRGGNQNEIVPEQVHGAHPLINFIAKVTTA